MTSALLVIAAVAAALALLVAGFVVLEILRRRLRAYRHEIGYDVRADHHFRFDPAFGRSVELVIEDDVLTLPEFTPDEDSAFLEVRVSTGFAGRVNDPCLETNLAGQVQCHYVERGASGRRYFNLSGFMGATPGDRRLALKGRRLAFGSRATLHILRGARPPEGPVLVLAPHPDDAEIAAFGLLSTRPSWVVTVTLGDAGPNLYGAHLPDKPAAYLEKARMRAWDSVSIPMLAVTPPVFTANLGYFDGTLARMRQSPDEPVSPLHHPQRDVSALRINRLDNGQPPRDATWRNLVADMRKLLLEARPTAVALPHPVIDPHPDHRCTSLALMEALAELPELQGKLLFYANHLAMTELYPVGPCEGPMSIPTMLDDSVAARTVWSLSLDPMTRLRKRIALETHHDLRPPQYQDHRSLVRVLKDAVLAPYTFLVKPDADYVRRAARPNELYFVADFSEADEIRRAALKSWPGATSTSP